MKYIGEFNDINELTYKVEIETPTEGEDETLLMSGEPVIISYEGADEQAYKPYKCSTATISFLTKEANFDLIDAFANRVKVNIYKDGEVIWCGYATPNAYSQSYEDYLDVFELECQDGISTLQYYDYDYIECYHDYGSFDEDHPYNNSLWNRGITTHNKATNFFHLIMKMNKKLGGLYKNIYVTDSVINPYTRDISILDSIYISESNFFDEDGKPMKMLEVLEEICRYCNITCVPYGEDLYFVNYDAIAQELNSYFAYERISDTKYNYLGKKTLQSIIDIGIDSFREKGCKINIDSVYNYNEVKNDLYSTESLVPSIEDSDLWLRTTSVDSGVFPKNTLNTVDWINTDEDSKNYGEIHIKNTRHNKQLVFLRYHGYNWIDNLNNRYIFYYYKMDDTDYNIKDEIPLEQYDVDNVNYRRFNWGNTYDKNGACIVEYAVKAVNDWNEVKTIDYETAIMIHTTSKEDKETYNNVWVTAPKQPMVKILTEPQLMKKGDYIVINGEMAVYHYWDKVPIDEGIDDNTIFSQTNMWVSLKLGEFYWNGSEWVVPESGGERVAFQIPFEYHKDQKAFNNFIPFDNIISYDMNLEAEGFCVPCLPRNYYKTDEGEINTIEFTIYRPYALTNKTAGRTFLIKNLDIRVVGQKNEIINDDSENTIYTNIRPIDNNVSEYDEVTCKVCSWSSKVFNWSQTFYIQYYKYKSNQKRFYQGGVSFIDDDATVQMSYSAVSENYITELLSNTILESSLIFKSINVIYDVAKGYALKPEELIISKNVEQYDNPTLNLSVNLKMGEITPFTRFTYDSQFPNFIFTVDKITYNLRENEAEVKLINKKIDYEE